MGNYDNRPLQNAEINKVLEYVQSASAHLIDPALKQDRQLLLLWSALLILTSGGFATLDGDRLPIPGGHLKVENAEVILWIFFVLALYHFLSLFVTSFKNWRSYALRRYLWNNQYKDLVMAAVIYDSYQVEQQKKKIEQIRAWSKSHFDYAELLRRLRYELTQRIDRVGMNWKLLDNDDFVKGAIRDAGFPPEYAHYDEHVWQLQEAVADALEERQKTGSDKLMISGIHSAISSAILKLGATYSEPPADMQVAVATPANPNQDMTDAILAVDRTLSKFSIVSFIWNIAVPIGFFLAACTLGLVY